MMEARSNIRRIDAELLFREGQQFQANHALTKALECYRRAAALEPSRGLVHLRIGLILSKLGRWQEALDAYLDAIRVEPELAEAHLNLGFVYYELGMDDRAQAALEHARKLGALANPPEKMRF